MFQIYAIENIKTHQKYIGMTKRSAQVRFLEHCQKSRRSRISQAIHTDGKESFKLYLITKNTPNWTLAAFQELKTIITLKTLTPNGYNVQCAGQAAAFLQAAASGHQLRLF